MDRAHDNENNFEKLE